MTIEVLLKQPHPAQQEVLSGRKRFNAINCGRRWGKTEMVQELSSESIEARLPFAYFSPTYKDLYEVWQEIKTVFHPIIDNVSETVKQIQFIGGAKMDFWSMEEPDSGRGRKYARVIVDECEKARKFKQAWEQSILATLADYGGDAYLLSTPKMGPTFFKELCKFQEKFPDHWKTFNYSTYTNPHIPVSEIEALKLIMHPLVFRCEIMAEDVSSEVLQPFLYAFDPSAHFDYTIGLMADKPVIFITDFNLSPFAGLVAQIYRENGGLFVHCLSEIPTDTVGSVPAMGERIKTLYGQHLYSCHLSGDRNGTARNLSQVDHASNYELLRRQLGLRHNQLVLPPNPPHKQSRNDCNYLLHIAKDPRSGIYFKINPKGCPTLAMEAQTTQCDNEGHIIKSDRSQEDQRADYLDCLRYLVNGFLKRDIDRHQRQHFGKLPILN